MKTKTIPFDLETAKKIQAGEIEGAIKTRDGYSVRLLCTDLKNKQRMVAAITTRNDSESVELYGVSGCFLPSRACSSSDLVLEIPDTEPQFKLFDKVLVRDEDDCEWCPAFYGYYDEVCEAHHRVAGGGRWHQCIPYEGNQELVGTIKKPKDYGDK